MALWLICDASGSMIEGGKRFVVRGLVREVEQYCRLGYAPQPDLRLVTWRDEVLALPWQPGDEVPAEQLDCRGSGNASSLVQLVGSASGDRFLILTDGFWTDESARELKKWRAGLAGDALRILTVGADANPKISGFGVFEPENFFAALDGWLVA